MSNITPLDVAQSYRRRNWCPIPVNHREKRSLVPGWQDLRLSDEELPEHFSGNKNVGVLLGVASGDLADIDLDCMEAVELAPEFLLDTMAFGRLSKPKSHWLYMSPGSRTAKYCDTLHPVPDLDANGIQKIGKDGKPKTKFPTLVELRFSGQTVFPGSIHESGEPINWCDGPDSPRAWECDELARHVACLAVAAYIKRNEPDHLEEYLRNPDDIPPGLSAESAKLMANWLGHSVAGSEEKKQEPASGAFEAFTKARRHFNADHPLRATKKGGACPAKNCEGSNSFKGDDNKASCFHSSHPDSCGTRSSGCFVFDPLDLAAHNEGTDPKELLRAGGYLRAPDVKCDVSEAEFDEFLEALGRKPPKKDPRDATHVAEIPAHVKEAAAKVGPKPKTAPEGDDDGGGKGKKKGPYAKFGDPQIMRLLVPLLDMSHVLLRRADGTERTYHVNSRNEGTPQLSNSSLEQAIFDALTPKFGPPPQHILSRAIALWHLAGRRIPTEPAPFLFSDAPMEQMCLKRLEWSPTPGAHPAWDEFLTRLSDPDAFKSFVWSIFELRSKSRQYMWLRGEGEDGKSVVLRTLRRIMGQACHGLDHSAMRETRFLNSAVYGKRLIIYSDCKNRRFGMTEHVRNWTSGDPVQVEAKGEPAFTAEFNCRLVIASNLKPEFTGQNADSSRALYIEVAESKSKDDPTWEDRLAAELPAFLDTCRDTYVRLVPNMGKIPLNEASTALRDGAAEEFEEAFAVIFEDKFYATEDGVVSASDFRKALYSAGLDDNGIGDFRIWIERKYRVKSRRSNASRWYEGMALR